MVFPINFHHYPINIHLSPHKLSPLSPISFHLSKIPPHIFSLFAPYPFTLHPISFHLWLGNSLNFNKLSVFVLSSVCMFKEKNKQTNREAGLNSEGGDKVTTLDGLQPIQCLTKKIDRRS